jgi:hypothetical protein
MSLSLPTLGALTFPLVIGLGLSGLAVTSGTAGTAGNSAIQCGVLANTENGMLVLEGTLLSPTDVVGDYSFAFTSSGQAGSSNIRQGGGFSAAADAVTTLGRVTINAGSNYDVDFTVNANGQTLDCAGEIASLR